VRWRPCPASSSPRQGGSTPRRSPAPRRSRSRASKFPIFS
jgi:hypothetical protein